MHFHQIELVFVGGHRVVERSGAAPQRIALNLRVVMATLYLALQFGLGARARKARAFGGKTRRKARAFLVGGMVGGVA